MARMKPGDGWGEKVTVRKVGHGGKRTGTGCGKNLIVSGIAGIGYGLYELVTALL